MALEATLALEISACIFRIIQGLKFVSVNFFPLIYQSDVVVLVTSGNVGANNISLAVLESELGQLP
jgi:hypothetical protein